MRPNCILEKGGAAVSARARQRRKAAERWCFVDFTNRLEEARLVCNVWRLLFGSFAGLREVRTYEYLGR